MKSLLASPDFASELLGQDTRDYLRMDGTEPADADDHQESFKRYRTGYTVEL
jgi:hypothetical protein